MSHARFSPSNSKRWLNCTKSMLLPKKVEKQRDTTFSNRGTALHSAAEDLILKGMIKPEYDGYVPTEEDLFETVNPYVQYVQDIAKEGTTLWIEKKVYIAEECYGTADAVSYNKHTGVVHVMDLKAGQGVFVPVHKNTQLQIYALGAWNALIELGIYVKKMYVHVLQPGMANMAMQEISLVDLTLLEELIISTIDEINEGEGVYDPSEEACRWCPHKIDCPKLNKMATESAYADFNDFDFFEASHLELCMKRIPLLKQFIKVVEDKALEHMSQDKPLDGFKLVQGKGNRKWKSDEEMQYKLMVAGFKAVDLYEPRKLLSVPKIEKLLKKNKMNIDIDELTVRKDTAPRVVADSNMLVKIDRTQNAVLDFKNIK